MHANQGPFLKGKSAKHTDNINLWKMHLRLMHGGDTKAHSNKGNCSGIDGYLQNLNLNLGSYSLCPGLRRKWPFVEWCPCAFFSTNSRSRTITSLFQIRDFRLKKDRKLLQCPLKEARRQITNAISLSCPLSF